MNQLGKKTANGAAINVAVTVTKTALQFIVVLPILARVLTPEEFGLVAMAMAFVSFFTMFNDLGISAALVRADDPSPAFWSSAFWTNLALGVGLTLLVNLAAPWIALFFAEPVVEPLVNGLSCILLMHCAFLVPMAWLQRNFMFRTIAMIDLVATLLSTVVAIGVALGGYGVWALVWQQITLYLVKMLGGLACHRAPFRLTYDADEIIRVLPFSLGLTGTAFTAFINRNTDNILIGRFLGSAALGYYGRAYQMMLMPVHTLANGASFALYPAMSAIKQDRNQLGNVYLKSMSILSTLMFPMMIGLALVSVPFVAVMFGPQWGEVAPVLRILAFVGILQGIGTITNVVWKALGRADILLRWALVRTVGFVLAFCIGIYIGTLTAMAMVYLVANIIFFIPFQLQILRALGQDTARFLTTLAPQFFSSVAMAAALLAAQAWLPGLEAMNSPIQLLVLVGLGVLAYGAAMLGLFRPFVHELWGETRTLFLSRGTA